MANNLDTAFPPYVRAHRKVVVVISWQSIHSFAYPVYYTDTPFSRAIQRALTHDSKLPQICPDPGFTQPSIAIPIYWYSGRV
jgi:hypothetical protein